jgi:cyclopropane fatty-acyl-phospholipid synthase-like methyltransferase
MTNKTTTNKSRIVKYYNTCEIDYKLFWELERSLAMHAGYWDETTATLTEALARENQVLAEWAHVSPQDRILDAGCGIGGSAIYLAKYFGCHVTGITLSEKQAATARQKAKEHGVEALTHFQVIDYCNTPFPDASFNIIWGLESICHTLEKSTFVTEAFRLLKPKGRLIVADGFALKEKYTPNEHYGMKKWLQGWAVDSLDTMQSFKKHLQNSGFENISYRDITKNVMPSSKRLYWISFPAFVFSKMGEWINLRTPVQTENIKGAYYQYKTLNARLWSYGVFVAQKP